MSQCNSCNKESKCTKYDGYWLCEDCKKERKRVIAKIKVESYKTSLSFAMRCPRIHD